VGLGITCLSIDERLDDKNIDLLTGNVALLGCGGTCHRANTTHRVEFFMKEGLDIQQICWITTPCLLEK
jgi:hypothetical protein